MKYYLLAGTSALALTLVAGVANAQTAPGKFDIKISGDAFFEAGFIGQDKGSNTKVNDFQNRFRVVVNPVAQADNGITYGALARLRANAGTGLIDGDQAYIFVSGNFGTIRAGAAYGANDATYVAHPMDWQMASIYDQWRTYMTTSGNSSGTQVLGYTGSQSSANFTATGGAVRNVTLNPVGTVPVGAVAVPFRVTADQNGNVVPGTASVAATTPGRRQSYAWGQFGNGGSATNGVQLIGSHNIDTKLVYFSPRFFGQTPTTGLQAAFSYAPRSGDGTDGGISVNTDGSRQRTLAGGPFSLQRTTFNDVYEATFNYVEKSGPWMGKIGGGYTGGSSINDTPTQTAATATAAASGFDNANNYKGLSSYQLGAQIGYENFVLGGGYVWGGDSGYTSARFVNGIGAVGRGAVGSVKSSIQAVGFVPTQRQDQTAWNLGAQYTWGAIVVGVKYMEETDAGNLALNGDRTLGALTLGGQYTIAPGLRAGAEYTHFSAGSDVPGSSDNGDVVLLRTSVAF
ncbi:MAG: porin [Rhodospirillaceae bacterium]